MRWFICNSLCHSIKLCNFSQSHIEHLYNLLTYTFIYPRTIFQTYAIIKSTHIRFRQFYSKIKKSFQISACIKVITIKFTYRMLQFIHVERKYERYSFIPKIMFYSLKQVNSIIRLTSIQFIYKDNHSIASFRQYRFKKRSYLRFQIFCFFYVFQWRCSPQ